MWGFLTVVVLASFFHRMYKTRLAHTKPTPLTGRKGRANDVLVAEIKKLRARVESLETIATLGKHNQLSDDYDDVDDVELFMKSTG